MTVIRVVVGSTNPCKLEAVRKAFEEVLVSRTKGNVQFILSSFNVPSGMLCERCISISLLLYDKCISFTSCHHIITTFVGVSDQPFGDVETREGAMNRAQAAYDAACSGIEDEKEYPDFAVGLEGGLEKQGEELWCMAWMAILGSNSSACFVAKSEDDNYTVSEDGKEVSPSWGYAKTGAFLLPPALCDLVINKNMELGHADDMIFKRINSKHGQGTIGKLTDGEIDRTDYYVHAIKLALIPWIRPELYLK